MPVAEVARVVVVTQGTADVQKAFCPGQGDVEEPTLLVDLLGLPGGMKEEEDKTKERAENEGIETRPVPIPEKTEKW